ncbi:hypothetical protein ACE6H2_004377 [Prunus campanulata]
MDLDPLRQENPNTQLTGKLMFKAFFCFLLHVSAHIHCLMSVVGSREKIPFLMSVPR